MQRIVAVQRGNTVFYKNYFFHRDWLDFYIICYEFFISSLICVSFDIILFLIYHRLLNTWTADSRTYIPPVGQNP